MKKAYILVLLIAFATINTSKAQYVTIPDADFVHWLDTSGYASCLSGNQLDTTCSAVLTALTMRCYAVPIHDLSGVQYFKALVDLDCSNDSIYIFPAVPASIRNIICSYNNLTTLPALPDSLTNLACAHNKITNLAPFPSLLTYLDCNFNQLSVLPALPGGLMQIFCDYNQIGIIPALPLSLNTLSCIDNHISQLPVLPSALNNLFCDYNNLTALPAFPSSLYQCTCQNNQITALPALHDSLQYLACGFNQISVMPPLPRWLVAFDCASNLISVMPPLPDSLQYFGCAHNLLTSMPPLPGALNSFECADNQLTSLPTLPDSLYYFDVTGNQQLTCLPQLKRVVQFFFDSTAITCLPNYGTVDTSSPALHSIPLCGIFNPSACNPYWNISGNIYYDANANCAFDSADPGEEYVKVMLNSGGMQQQVYSSFGGGYSFLANQNTNYQITIDTTNVPFVLSCPVSGYLTSVVTPANPFSYDNNFALQCRPDGIDAGVQSILNGWIIPRPAANFILWTVAGDISDLYGAHCAAGVSGQVTLTYTGQVTFHGSAGGLTPTSVTGNVITWNIADFGTVDARTAFNTFFTIDTTASAGTQACFTVNVTANAPDYNPANNTGYFCFTIVDALDPNEKEVSPAGNIDTAQKWLTYTIRFQNTGSAPAQNIKVTDTLDSNLDPSTFQLLSASAKNLTQVFGNVVVFSFPNINLVDSLVSDSGSRGYVQYKIKRRENLPLGTQIRNTANIYFDYNSAVVTNTTNSTLWFPTGIKPVGANTAPVSFTLYPNPAKDYTIVNVSDNLIGGSLVLTDAIGRTILSEQITGNKYQVHTGALAKGVYMVKVAADGVGEVVKKLVIE